MRSACGGLHSRPSHVDGNRPASELRWAPAGTRGRRDGRVRVEEASLGVQVGLGLVRVPSAAVNRASPQCLGWGIDPAGRRARRWRPGAAEEKVIEEREGIGNPAGPGSFQVAAAEGIGRLLGGRHPTRFRGAGPAADLVDSLPLPT